MNNLIYSLVLTNELINTPSPLLMIEATASPIDADPIANIYDTFKIRHREGTDRNLEVAIVKIILIREGHLMRLIHLCNKPITTVKQKDMHYSIILEAMYQLRESTINYLEALCRWRQSLISDNSSPLDQSQIPFVWEGKNYTVRTHFYFAYIEFLSIPTPIYLLSSFCQLLNPS